MRILYLLLVVLFVVVQGVAGKMGIGQVGEMGWQGPRPIQQGEVQSPAPGEEQPQHQEVLWATSFRGSAGKKLGVLEGSKLGMSEQCALTAKRASRYLGSSGQSLSSSPGEVIFALYSTLLRPHLECWAQF